MASRQDEIGTPEGIRTPGLLLRRQLLYPTELLAHIGAGDENRTRIPSLEGWCPGHCATPAYKPPARIILQQQIVSFVIIAHSAAVVNRIFLEFTTKNWGGSMLVIKRFFFMDRLGRNNSKTFRMLKHHLRIIFRFCAARRSKVWLASSRKVTSRCQCILSTLQ